ncbi:MAG: chorismate mutase, partial [Brevundimonas sp.]
MSPVSPLKQIWPEAAEMTPEQMALAALRQEIDALDDALLDLFQQRLALASRVGLAKDAPAGPH